MMTFFTILSFMEFLFKISALFICFSDSFKSLHDLLTKAGVPQESIVFTFFCCALMIFLLLSAVVLPAQMILFSTLKVTDCANNLLRLVYWILNLNPTLEVLDKGRERLVIFNAGKSLFIVFITKLFINKFITKLWLLNKSLDLFYVGSFL